MPQQIAKKIVLLLLFRTLAAPKGYGLATERREWVLALGNKINNVNLFCIALAFPYFGCAEGTCARQ